MKYSLKLFAVITLTVVLCGCARQRPDGNDTLYVSILPLRGLVQEIVGDDFPIEVLVPPGASPETFEPTPRQFVALNRARMVFNVGLIDFETALLAKLEEPGKVIDLSAGVEPIAGSCSHGSHTLHREHSQGNNHGPSHAADRENDRAGHNDAPDCENDNTGHNHAPSREHSQDNNSVHSDAHNHPHSHAHGVDPHIWTSPKALRQMAANAYEAIRQAYPDSMKYERNYLALQEKLDELDRSVAERIARSGTDRFVVYHPALTYYARDYGLRQIAIEADGKEPSARRLARLIREAREAGVRSVFYQREFPASVVEIIASDIGARAVEIDPLREDAVANILEITDLITAQ